MRRIGTEIETQKKDMKEKRHERKDIQKKKDTKEKRRERKKTQKKKDAKEKRRILPRIN